jgi:hypothetical protein
MGWWSKRRMAGSLYETLLTCLIRQPNDANDTSIGHGQLVVGVFLL